MPTIRMKASALRAPNGGKRFVFERRSTPFFPLHDFTVKSDITILIKIKVFRCTKDVSGRLGGSREPGER